MLSGVPKENLFIYLFDLKGIYFVFLFRNISGLAWYVGRLGSKGMYNAGNKIPAVTATS
jgi:hypothetical protein